MANTKLHLDADVSFTALEKALRERGHDVTRTPCAWMPFDASDRTQLLEATACGRCILTFIGLSLSEPEEREFAGNAIPREDNL